MPFYNSYQGCLSYKDRLERAQALLQPKIKKRDELKRKISSINRLSLFASIATIYLTSNVALEYMFLFAPIAGTLLTNYLHNGDILVGLEHDVERFEEDIIKYRQLHKREEKLNSESFFGNYKKEPPAPKKPEREPRQSGIFDNCTTVEDIKKTYKEKAKKCHPDLGGNTEEFIILNTEYKKAIDLASAA